MDALGTHLLLDLKECNSKLLDDMQYLRQIMISVANEAGATVVGEKFHKFSPHGVTGIVAIAESHICLHTWPEYNYAAVDIFSCGSVFKPHMAAELIVKHLQSGIPEITEVRRGLLTEMTTAPLHLHS